ncbi:MAG TPA: hypothetical protein VMU32_11100, partial [Solirubrobacteraceae bacterium]|nr:hypothetical protein [Solirubrobacteraceae bacterium]
MAGATASLTGATAASAAGAPHNSAHIHSLDGRRAAGKRHRADGHHRRRHRRRHHHHKGRRPTVTPKPGGVALLPIPSPTPVLSAPIGPVTLAALPALSPTGSGQQSPGGAGEGEESKETGGGSEKSESSEKNGNEKGGSGEEGGKGPEEESPPPPPPAPVNTAKPASSGVVRQNEKLKSSAGTWKGSPTAYAYQWQVCSAAGRDCTNIAGATGSSHTLGAGEVEHTIRVVVTATNSGGSTSADSAVSGKVAPATTRKPPPKEETEPPKEETKPPTEETEPPKEETKPPTEETEPPKEETKPPTEETEPPKEETEPPKEEKEPPKEEKEAPKEEAPKEETPPTEETTPPTHTPPPSPACTQTFSSVSAAASALDSAAPEAAICLSAGSYGHLSVSGTHGGDVTIEPVPGSVVHLEGVTVAAGASHITIHDFSIGGGVSLGAGDSHITVDHNDIDGEASGGDGEGVETLSVNCSAPNAPTYSGCTSTAPDSYITINGNKIHGYGQGDTEDAIHLNDWEHVTITANDIYALEEHGNHTDAMQSVFGGHYMLFERNYEHDNQSQ